MVVTMWFKGNCKERYKVICTPKVWSDNNGSVTGACMIGDNNVQFLRAFLGRFQIIMYYVIR